ncbi:MAG TPA: NAD(P)-dependent oxidoreductase [Piscinibacter sp.]|uniref:NAD(P)-dependent oxidoreductase n=1 Tax=Piscinibacter sp. TaxID=1903157 RepID=UPI002BA0E33C|nr:NAD(P)-dependent oxidoreductase [Pseudomonadota bacterium]HNJ82136.1 NAD(P)-dependent oxidoreductase [Piscinibacter sp.]HNK17092.1 NAD(P)-dependent oxidoreductase [Piscinibacter sp.]
MSKPTVGFVGVGLMGHGMAKNLVSKGWPLVVLGHRKREPVEHLKSLGAREAATPRELAAQCEIVHLCVTGSPQVEATLRGPDGLLAGAAPGTVIIDCSTSNPVSTLALAEEAKARGVHFVDAPLSRTPKEAEAGTLDTMVGAEPEVFARIEPVLRAWAGNVVHLGPVGLGHKMKLINNFVAMGYAALFSEALAIARKSGLTVEQFHSVIGSGRMRSPFYDTFMQWTLAGDENAHRFTIANAHKDMRYLAAMANEAGAVNLLQPQVKNMFAAMQAAGQGERFVPMLADFIAGLNGLAPAGSKE